jgi:hypothetical protein
MNPSPAIATFSSYQLPLPNNFVGANTLSLHQVPPTQPSYHHSNAPYIWKFGNSSTDQIEYQDSTCRESLESIFSAAIAASVQPVVFQETPKLTDDEKRTARRKRNAENARRYASSQP